MIQPSTLSSRALDAGFYAGMTVHALRISQSHLMGVGARSHSLTSRTHDTSTTLKVSRWVFKTSATVQNVSPSLKGPKASFGKTSK